MITPGIPTPWRRHRALRSVRVSVAWQGGRIRSVRLEYGRPHLVRRILSALRW